VSPLALALLGLLALALPLVLLWLVWPPLSVGAGVLMVWGWALCKAGRGRDERVDGTSDEV
jgi:hypothetical protein